MEETNIEVIVDEQSLAEGDTGEGAFVPGESDGFPLANEVTSDKSEDEIKPSMSNGINCGLVQNSAGFNLGFDPKNAPRLELLYQVCHTSLWTATHLSTNETHRQRLVSEALRVRIWGLDLFDGTQCAPLDKLLSLPSLSRTSTRRHLIGVWADIAATMEAILKHLITAKDGEIKPESYDHWRRLRIVLGLEDIASIVHDGLGSSETTDSDSSYDDSSEFLNESIDSLEGRIDCLFDLSVTVGTIRQLHKLGFKPNTTILPTFNSVEDQVDKTDNEIGDSLTPTSPAINVIFQTSPSISLIDLNLSAIADDLPNNQNAIPDKFPDDEKPETSRIGTSGMGKTLVDFASGSDQVEQPTVSFEESAIKSPGKPSRKSHERSSMATTLVDTASGSDQVEQPTVSFEESAIKSPGKPSRKSHERSSRKSHGKSSKNSPRKPQRDPSENSSGDLSKHHDRFWSRDSDSRNPIKKLGRTSSNPVSAFQKPIKFQDGFGRTFTFPFDLCRTWENMKDLIEEAFEGMIGPYADSAKAYINDGKYDLVCFDNEVVLPSQWETMAEPGMTVGLRIGFGSKLLDFRPDNSSSHLHSFPRNIFNPGPPIPPPSPALRQENLSKGKESQRSQYQDNEEKLDSSYDEEATPTGIHINHQGRKSFPATVRPPLGVYYPSITQSSTLPIFDDLGINSTSASYPPAIPNYTYGYEAPLPVSIVPSRPLIPPESGRTSIRSEIPQVVPSVTEAAAESAHKENHAQAEEESSPADERGTDARLESKSKAKEKTTIDLKQRKAKMDQKAQEGNGTQIENDSLLADRIAEEVWVRLEKTINAKKQAELRIDEMASTKVAATKLEPIHFVDPIGRKFAFPYKSCSTWDGMEFLVKQAFLHVEEIGPHVAQGHYDLIDPTGEILLPLIWESSIRPGWKVTMQMWPITDPPQAQPSSEPKTPKSPVYYSQTIEEPKQSGSQVSDDIAKPPTASKKPVKSNPEKKIKRIGQKSSLPVFLPPPPASRSPSPIESDYDSEDLHRLGNMRTKVRKWTRSKIERIVKPELRDDVSHLSYEDEELEEGTKSPKWKDRVRFVLGAKRELVYA